MSPLFSLCKVSGVQLGAQHFRRDTNLLETVHRKKKKSRKHNLYLLSETKEKKKMRENGRQFFTVLHIEYIKKQWL